MGNCFALKSSVKNAPVSQNGIGTFSTSSGHSLPSLGVGLSGEPTTAPGVERVDSFLDISWDVILGIARFAMMSEWEILPSVKGSQHERQKLSPTIKKAAVAALCIVLFHLALDPYLSSVDLRAALHPWHFQKGAQVAVMSHLIERPQGQAKRPLSNQILKRTSARVRLRSPMRHGQAARLLRLLLPVKYR